MDTKTTLTEKDMPDAPRFALPEYGDLETECREHLAAVKNEMKRRDADTKALRNRNNNVDYYFVVCFETGAQVEAVTKKLGLKLQYGAFVNGYEFAEKVGIDVPPDNLGSHKIPKNRRFAALSDKSIGGD